jgi:hypothetical protein
MLLFTPVSLLLGLHVFCSHAGDLLTVSKRLHIRAPVKTVMSTRRLLHQEPASQSPQTSSDSGRLPSTTTISSASSSTLSQPEISQRTTNARHLLESGGAAARIDVEHISPQRYLTQGNQLVGGLFLHLTRKMSVVSCSHLFSKKLSHACSYEKAAGISTPGAATLTGCCAWSCPSDAELQADS